MHSHLINRAIWFPTCLLPPNVCKIHRALIWNILQELCGPTVTRSLVDARLAECLACTDIGDLMAVVLASIEEDLRPRATHDDGLAPATTGRNSTSPGDSESIAGPPYAHGNNIVEGRYRRG